MNERLFICLLPLAILWTFMPLNIFAQRDMDPCHLFANGTKLRDPDDCSQELICINFKSVYGVKCSGSTPFYNKDTQKCDKSLTNSTTCAIDCKNKTGLFVRDPKTCFGYYYCQDDSLALYGQCPKDTHFNETLQYCIHSYKSNCKFLQINFCAIVKSGVNFKDESYCGGYYTCDAKKNELVRKNCTDKERYFDATLGKCTKNPTGDCHALPSNVCGTKLKPKRNTLVADRATCRGYFYCANIGKLPDPNPTWLQCPENLFFSESKQKCLPPLEVRCNYDRCEGRQLTFVVSSEKGCRHYYLCKDGVKIQEGTCGNYFFDEEKGACTHRIITYPACNYK